MADSPTAEKRVRRKLLSVVGAVLTIVVFGAISVWRDINADYLAGWFTACWLFWGGVLKVDE